MHQAIDKAFQFLISSHQFSKFAESYRSLTIWITPDFNERDGFETHIMFPNRGSDRIGVGTILAALDVIGRDDPKSHASFLQLHFRALTELPEDRYNDLCSLRFWHAPRWRKAWGTTIKMTQGEIAQERLRLTRMKEYFGGAANV